MAKILARIFFEHVIPLCDIFNNSLTEGIVLVLKKQAVIVPVPKTYSFILSITLGPFY